MKKIFFILLAGSFTSLLSCTKNSEAVNSDLTTPDQSGTTTIKTVPYVWKINSFIVNGSDITAQFADYKFDFHDPEMIAVNSGNVFYGKLERVYTNLSFTNLVINFPAANVGVLSQLNENWAVNNNQQYDLALQTGSKALSFHTDGEVWNQ